MDDFSFSLGDLDFLNDDFEDKNDSSLTQILEIPTQQLVNIDDKRFATPVSSVDLKINQENRIPKKTRQANNWTLSLWKDWVKYRNSRPETFLEGEQIPEDISQLSNARLDFWLQRFIVEIRRKDGTPYPPNTLTQIVAGLQRHLRNVCTGRQFNFFKDNDNDFVEFRKTLDAKMKELTSKGIGIQKKRCDPVTEADETKMWDCGVFSTETSSGLSNAVFFYNGKAFAFRGMEQHKQCDAEQFQIGYDHENKRKFIKYFPRITKNVQGGLKHRRIEINPITQYEDPDNDRCLVKLYEKYLSLIPQKGPLYRKPLDSVPGTLPRFSANCIPINQLSNMFKKFYADAGINTDNRNISNHSGRVTCCTRLYNAGFTDKAVISRSNHRSNAVHTYQREQFNILQDISNVVGPPRGETEDVVKNESNESETMASVQKVENEAPATGSARDNTLTIFIPSAVNKVVLVKSDGSKISMDL